MLPEHVVITDLSSNELVKKLNRLEAETSKLAAGKHKDNSQVKAFVEDFTAYFVELYSRNSDGEVPIVEAAKQGQLKGQMAHAYFLRVAIENQGGTLIERKNLWTALGASKLAISGMAQVRYSLTDPSGEVIGSGSTACGTDLTAFSKVKQELTAKAACVEPQAASTSIKQDVQSSGNPTLVEWLFGEGKSPSSEETD